MPRLTLQAFARPMTRPFDTLVMTHATATRAPRLHATSQEMAIHMIATAARILLMVGTAILVGEVAAGPGRKLLQARANHRLSNNEDGEPND